MSESDNEVGKAMSRVAYHTHRNWTTLTRILAITTMATGSLFSQHQSASSNYRNQLISFLRSYLTPSGDLKDETTRVTISTLKTSGKTPLEVIYISGQSWCGSGGCRLLILEHRQSSFKVLGMSTIVHLPVRFLGFAKNGYPDIGVWVQGGGILRGYEAALSFDGATYPSNPSVPPARQLPRTEGGVIISRASGSFLLYK